MRITYLRLKNWRNFRSADLSLLDRVFIVGPNASGKSNLLDAIRFLRDVASSGFWRAVHSRGGLTRVRCLAARNYNRGHVTLAVGIGDDDHPERWRYELTFKSEGRGQRRPIIQKEQVIANGEVILERPDERDLIDPELLTQAHLIQVTVNRDFREMAEFLSSISYSHIVPQFLRHPERVSVPDRDPFGGDLITRIANTKEKTRKERLLIINKALRIVAPQMENLQLVQDVVGRWHLGGRYEHWRSQKALQNERDFSDGTLRLIGLMWALLDSNGPILLEEPELSLHSDAVRQIPAIISILQMTKVPQVILTTHSSEMLQDLGVEPEEVVLIQPTALGSIAKTADQFDRVHEIMDMDFPVGDAVRPITQADDINNLAAELLPA